MRLRWGLIACSCSWVAPLAMLLASCRVTGVDANDSLYNETQAETAISVSNVGGTPYVTVAYNTPDKPGGGQWIGWSYWDGAWNHRRDLQLPTGWKTRPDPSLTTVPGNELYVFLASLAETPNERFGVCVWRSINVGRNFNFWQCFPPPSDSAYDGTSLTAGADGSIYLATWATSAGRIEVFRAASVNSTFTRVSGDPFPGFHISTHPRLHVEVVPAFGAPFDYVLWVVAATRENQLVANGYSRNNGGWGTPTVIASDLVPSNSPGIQLSSQLGLIRIGPQFSFDVGYDDVSTFEPALRAAFTRRTSENRHYVRGARCTIAGRGQLGTCTEEPGWASDAGGAGASGDQWSPLVAWHGRILGSNTWVLSYSSRQEAPSGNTISFWGGKLLRGQLFNPARVFDAKEVCAGGLAWGDYDDIRFFGTDPDGADVFLRTHTDSSVGVERGCVNQGSSGDQHVSIAVVN